MSEQTITARPKVEELRSAIQRYRDSEISKDAAIAENAAAFNSMVQSWRDAGKPNRGDYERWDLADGNSLTVRFYEGDNGSVYFNSDYYEQRLHF